MRNSELRARLRVWVTRATAKGMQNAECRVQNYGFATHYNALRRLRRHLPRENLMINLKLKNIINSFIVTTKFSLRE